jgi:hypothetical protein
VVVDHVEQDGEAGLMARRDEAGEALGPPVGLVDGVPRDAVVAPAALAVEGVDGHDLDVGDPEVTQVAEPLRRRVEGPLGGERPDVELVDRPVAQRRC